MFHKVKATKANKLSMLYHPFISRFAKQFSHSAVIVKHISIYDTAHTLTPEHNERRKECKLIHLRQQV